MSEIEAHDLVLHDGRVEEVSHLSVGRTHYMPKGVGCSHDYMRCENATRIGSTLPPENWRAHTGNERPADVGAEDRVEVFWLDGERSAHPFGCVAGWDESIAAYRIVSRAEQPAPDRDAEVRAVAGEMRKEGRRAQDNLILDWADRLDPPEPGPLKVGDRVRILPSVTEFAVVRAICKQVALIERDDGAVFGHAIGKLERIP